MVALPEIGLASQIVHRAKWYKFIGRLGFKAVEINRQHSKLQFNLTSWKRSNDTWPGST